MSDMFPGGIPQVSDSHEIRDRQTGEVQTFGVWATLQANQFGREIQWGRNQIMGLILKRVMFIVGSHLDKADMASRGASVGKLRAEKRRELERTEERLNEIRMILAAANQPDSEKSRLKR